MNTRERLPSMQFPSNEDWEELWEEMEQDERNPRTQNNGVPEVFGEPIEPDYDSLLDES